MSNYQLVDLMGDAARFSKDPITTVVHIVATMDGFRVVQAGRMADGLAFDEMLGQVVNLLHPKLGTPRYPMLTREEQAAAEARHKIRVGANTQKETAQ